MGGMDNKTSKELAHNRKKNGLINAMKSSKLYEEYLAHPTAQFVMTFLEYKKIEKKTKK